MDNHHTQAMQDGTVIHYRLWPANKRSDRAIVLLHGMASNLTRWSEFVEDTKLKNSWDLIQLDLRGHGESSPRSKIGMKIWCEDLVTLLDAEGYDQALLIGHSLGAQVAVQFTSRYPSRVSGLVLIDPIFHTTLRGFMWWLSQLKPLIWLAIGIVRLLNAFGIHRRHIPRRDLHRLDVQTRAALRESGNQKAIIRHYSSPWPDIKHFPTANYLQEFIESLRPLPPLSEINVPVLVLLSSGLTYTDPDKTKRSIAQFTDVQTVAINAYHWPLTEKPKEVRQAIEKWCARFSSR